MRILVTGSSGKLGRETVRRLRETQHTVVGVDLLGSDTTEKMKCLKNDQNINHLA